MELEYKQTKNVNLNHVIKKKKIDKHLEYDKFNFDLSYLKNVKTLVKINQLWVHSKTGISLARRVGELVLE